MSSAASQLVTRFNDFVITPIIVVVFAFGFLVFTFGLVQFLWNIRTGFVQEEGKRHMLWGIVGMVIMVSVYGIISIVNNTLELNAQNPDVSSINGVIPPANFTTP